MCGIGGYVAFDGAPPEARILWAMAEAMRRRGPDAGGVLIGGACGLAHRRLSIIDVAGSPQPMRVPGCDISLVYNGELYNYADLRRDLEQRGERFVTAGDTEVVLRMLARSWHSALKQFNGMFGIAAWDRRREKLLLARDPLGEKPLFFATPRPGVLVFGSEIKAVLEHPEVNRDLDLDALRQVLRFRSIYGRGSLYRGVRQLEAGTFIEFGRDGLREGRFFDLIEEVSVERSKLAGLSSQELVSRGEQLLEQSIRARLIADVPVGAFLSGGLDSSVIVAFVREAIPDGDRLRTFSVGFEHDRFSELSHAKTVATAMGTEHTEVHVRHDDYVRRLPELTHCRDAPISEPADVAIACMSRVARDTVKVVLSGEGADEIFGGYPKYRFARAPLALSVPVRMLGVKRTAKIAHAVGLETRRSIVAARALGLPRELDRLVQWFSYADRADLATFLPGLRWSEQDWSNTMDPQRSALNSASALGPLARMQLVDCLTWLPGNMLERGDRMTMAEGLEARPPFLDKGLAAFGLALPDRLKVRLWSGKWVVRQWAHRRLPKQIAQRKKWGFHVPLAEWFRGNLRDLVYGYLTAKNGICEEFGDRPRILKMLDAHGRGDADASFQLWTLLTTEVWYQDSFRGRSRVQTEGDDGDTSRAHNYEKTALPA